MIVYAQKEEGNITVTGSILCMCLLLLPTTREGNVFRRVCLSTIGLMYTGSLLGLVMAQSVRILPECFLVHFNVTGSILCMCLPLFPHRT